MISKTVIQIRAMKLIAIASGVGRIGDNKILIMPSLTPNPPGAITTIKPTIHESVYAAARLNIL